MYHNVLYDTSSSGWMNMLSFQPSMLLHHAKRERSDKRTRTLNRARAFLGLVCSLIAGCAESPGVSPTPMVPPIFERYKVVITPASACDFGGGEPSFQWFSPLPLTKQSSGVAMSLESIFVSLALTGAVSQDTLSYSFTARAASPLQETTFTGSGAAKIQGDVISGTFAGDVRYTPVSSQPKSQTCRSADHTLVMTAAR